MDRVTKRPINFYNSLFSKMPKMQNQDHHNIFVGTTYNTLLSIVYDTWICPLRKNLSQLLCWTCYIAYCQICILISDFVKSIYQKQTQVRLCLLKKYHFGVFFIQMPKTLFRMAKVSMFLYKKNNQLGPIGCFTKARTNHPL